MHFADNNRKMPGFAHIDFSSIVESLNEIGYTTISALNPTLLTGIMNLTKFGLDFVKRNSTYNTKTNKIS